MGIMELTTEEKQLINLIRDIHLEFGRIQLVLYLQDGKLIRAEIEKTVESRLLSK